MDSITKGILIQLKNEVKEIEDKLKNVTTIINDFEKYCNSSSVPNEEKESELTPEEQEELESMTGEITKAFRQSNTINKILETAKKNGTQVIGVPPGGGLVIGVDPDDMSVSMHGINNNSSSDIIPNIKNHKFFNDNVKARYGGRNISDKYNDLIKSRDYEDNDDVYDETQVMKDIAKVDFDLENIVEQKLECRNGYNYLGIYAGGDWEQPIWFFIYHDGKSLRGYVPYRGNCVNRLNKSAIGNDKDKDKEFLKDFGGGCYVDDVNDSYENYEECKKEFECRVGLRKVDKNGIPEED